MQIETFQNVLRQIFEQVEPAWRAQVIKNFRESAKYQFDYWIEKLAKPWPHDETGWSNRQIYDARHAAKPGQYVGKRELPRNAPYETEPYKNVEWWAWVQSHQSRYFTDYKKAEADANRFVDNAKDHFIYKQAKKLMNACKLKTKTPNVSGELILGSVITGHLDVVFGKDSFVLTMKIITNCRHSWKGTTYFNQFPSRFTEVKKNGEPVVGKNISEKWMGENF